MCGGAGWRVRGESVRGGGESEVSLWGWGGGESEVSL